MTPLERIEAKLDKVDHKLDQLRVDLGAHQHQGHVTWPWYISTTLVLVGLLVAVFA